MDDKTFQQFEEFIHSKSVAIIGTSSSAGYYWLRSFLDFGFPGKIYPVNPKIDEDLGLKFYKSLSEVPGDVDYAVLRVPARIVPSVLDECVAKNCKAITIFTSGYSELGTEEGRHRERLITEKIKSSPFRAFGPNCIGLACPETGFAFRPDLKPTPGPIGFVSQSGGKAIDCYLAVVETQLGISKIFSYGNEADISSWELVEYLHRDPKTQVIGIYIEGVRDGPRLRKAIADCATDKPVVVWKSGITEAGKRAVSSHSAALAGSTGTLADPHAGREQVLHAVLFPVRTGNGDSDATRYGSRRELRLAVRPQTAGAPADRQLSHSHRRDPDLRRASDRGVRDAGVRLSGPPHGCSLWANLRSQATNSKPAICRLQMANRSFVRLSLVPCRFSHCGRCQSRHSRS